SEEPHRSRAVETGQFRKAHSGSENREKRAPLRPGSADTQYRSALAEAEAASRWPRPAAVAAWPVSGLANVPRSETRLRSRFGRALRGLSAPLRPRGLRQGDRPTVLFAAVPRPRLVPFDRRSSDSVPDELTR